MNPADDTQMNAGPPAPVEQPATPAGEEPPCACAVVETRPSIIVGGCKVFGIPNGEYVPKADYDALAARLAAAEGSRDAAKDAAEAVGGVQPAAGEEPRLAEIEARAAKATEGPWYDDGYRIHGPTEADDKRDGEVLLEYKHAEATGDDGQFIAHARADIPWLVTQVRALAAKLATAEAAGDAAKAEAAGLRAALTSITRREDQKKVAAALSLR
jgi:hypothetical protein